MSNEPTPNPVPVEPTPPPAPPPAPAMETTVKPVSTATTINTLSTLQAIVGFLTAFLGVIQLSTSIFGSEWAGTALVLIGATMAGLQWLSSWINGRSSNKVQG